ncbi:MAG: hypothetical protein ABMA01_09845, partial [Chthoniobacteraceae bacterium]
MEATQPKSLALAATILLIANAAAAPKIEPQLPERWEPNESETSLLGEFEGQVSKISPKPRRFATTPAPEKIPGDFAPWWIRGQANSIGKRTHRQDITLEDLYLRAIRNSTQIRVFGDLPVIRETGIQEAKGAFDTNTFLKSQFDRTNDPV